MRRSLFVLLAACGEVKYGPPPTPAQRVELRDDIFGHIRGLAGRSEYVPWDADLVEPCIDEGLAFTGGGMPEPERRASFVEEAARCVSSKLRGPDGLKRIDKLVAERYAHPVIAIDKDRVTVDVGVIACPLTLSRGRLYMTDCPNKSFGEWATSEAQRMFTLARTKYPDAQLYELDVLLPSFDDKPGWQYVYERKLDRVTVTTESSPGVMYASLPMGGDPAHAASLRTLDLVRMTVDKPVR